jgi:Polyketide cyclase / dehydrase and lipid transport
VSRLSVAIDISATPSQVWHVVEPLDDHVEWMHDAVAIRFQTDQHGGVGTAFACDTKVGPFKLVDYMEITEWVPDSAMGVRHVGIVTGTGRFTLTPIDLGRRTRFSWEESLTFPWWLGGPIGASVGSRLLLRRIWRRNLRTLKHLIESPLPSP